jgi:hypothetical protein
MNRPSLNAASLLAIAVAFSLVLTPIAAHGDPAGANVPAATKPATRSAPLSERFADADATEVPDFQKHVVPLLGRLGCNGRACHGSFQGRGGFQLSLFGYDFKTDHEAMLDEDTGRVDVDDVDESLVLAKPVDADMHEGGKRFKTGSWQHHVLRSWIASGAKYDGKAQALVHLNISPSEIQFKDEGETVQLTAVAHWEDGTVEDVTGLCRFSSNDDGIAAIDENGHLQSGQSGDTHVVVYYDNAVVAVPVLRAIANTEPGDYPKSDHPIDQLVQQKLEKLGIMPSGLCTDAEFIRRASLDVTGILPSSDEVRQFLADTSADKRQRLIKKLLQSPGYAAWWATRFSDWTGNSEEQLNNVLPFRGAATRMWHQWLRVRLEQNVPYDDLVEGIVTANSRQQDESYLDYCASMTQACQPGGEEIFSQREGMPFYWARRNFAKPEERAIGFAYTFLGVRIECAQCHKHPFDQWSKDDFQQFSQLFTPIRVNQNLVASDAKEDREKLLNELTGGKESRGGDLRRAISEAAKDGKVVPFGELTVNIRSLSPQQIKQMKAARQKGRKVPTPNIPRGKILGADQSVTLDKDPRGELMQWLRSPENPYFAKAIVNRVWSNYFGSGIVDPTDDMNLANPPSNAPLLDYLASEFVAHDFDLKWLHRTILASDTYQRSDATNASNANDRVNFSHHLPRRLPAEVVYDSIALATGSDAVANQLREELDKMAIAEGRPRGRNQQDFALEVFGQSIRESNCDCDRTNAPSLLQSIYLRNDAEIFQRLSDKNGWVAQACEELGVKGPAARVDPQQAANQRRAEGLRRQFVGKVRQFSNSPEARQQRMRPQLQKEFKSLTSRLKQFGYATPSLKELLDDASSWTELQPAVASQEQANGKATVSMQSLVEEAYLRALSRYPDEQESNTSITFIEESETPAEGVQSLLWALVNTKEFIITH